MGILLHNKRSTFRLLVIRVREDNPVTEGQICGWEGQPN